MGSNQYRLIECYKDTEFGMEFANPAQLQHTELWLDAFVDDAEVGQNDFWNEHSDLNNMLSNFEKKQHKGGKDYSSPREELLSSQNAPGTAFTGSGA
jgi:hypothetical protein